MDKVRSAFKGLKNAQSPTVTNEVLLDVRETLSTRDFGIAKVVRHGFPHDPKCMAFDPVQRLLAVGCGNGSIRIFGRPGVDCHLQHETRAAVFQLQFLVNDGALLSTCKDDTIHLWNFRQKKPEVVHSLQFQKEPITCVHLPFKSQWFYVGTERGNVHVVNISEFKLSGYVINWNKAIDISQRNHPGSIKHLSDCPSDEAKLLIGFEKGTVVLWDLKTKNAAERYQCTQLVKSVSWNYEGKSFVCAHSDGSLSIWNVKGKGSEPVQHWAPHSRGVDGNRNTSPAEAKPREKCRPISQVEWKHGKGSEEFLIFSGGLPQDESGVLPAVTILRGGKSATVLEMEHPIVNFLTLCNSSYPNEIQEPFAVAVLLKTDFLIVDLTTPGYPCFENPYPMDIHESPVTLCAYLGDSPTDLIAAYYSVGSKQKRQGFSEKAWPITGGDWGVSASGNQEIIITGHSDGALKFWDASSENLQVLYKLKTGRHFERPEDGKVPKDMEYFAVENIALCPESRCLAVSGRASQVTLYRYVKVEASAEIPVLEVPIVYATGEEEKGVVENGPFSDERRGSAGSHQSIATSEGSCKEYHYPLKVRGGPLKRPAGYQPELVCLTPWMNSHTPEEITALAINTAYGLMAYGTHQGIGLIDIVQHTVVLAVGTPELYGNADPYNRVQPPSSLPSEREPPKGFSDPECSTPLSPNPGAPSNDRTESVESPGGKGSPRSSGPKGGIGGAAGKSPSLNSNAKSSQGTSPSFLRRPFQKAQSMAVGERPSELSVRSEKDIVPGRSRSSSSSSQDGIVTSESVLVLSFIDSFPTKNDSVECASVWVGTSLGSFISVSLNVPYTNRLEKPLTATPSGFLIRSKGSALEIGFINQSFSLLGPPAESWREKPTSQNRHRNQVVSKSRISPVQSTEEIENDQQYVVTVGERLILVHALPSQSCVFSVKLDVAFIRVKAATLKGAPLLVGCSVNGRVLVYSLPSLRKLLDKPFLTQNDMLAGKTLCFSHHGHGLYQCSPSELQKFTYSGEMVRQLTDVIGELFVASEMPEPPKTGLFTKLFAARTDPSFDRQELFGETSGRASKSVATRIPGPSGIDPVRAQGGSAMSDVAKARQLLDERGEKLGEVEERTAQLHDTSKAYADHASELVNKFKNKKWYQI